MTTATAQQIVDRACNELGLATSSLVPGLINATGTQSLSLLNTLGDDLVTAHDWQFLEGIVDLVGDGVTSEFDLPADYGRTVNQTLWSTNNKLPMEGPMSQQQWGWLNYGIVSVGVFYRYRILNNKMAVFPALRAGEHVKFYYIKKAWVIDQDTVTMKDLIVNGGDSPIFDRNLMIKGLKVRLWNQKGFDTTSLTREYDELLHAYLAQNQGAPVIKMSGRAATILLDPRRNVPDGNWQA